MRGKKNEYVIYLYFFLLYVFIFSLLYLLFFLCVYFPEAQTTEHGNICKHIHEK